MLAETYSWAFFPLHLSAEREMWGTRRAASSTSSSCGPAPKQGGPEARQGHAKTTKTNHEVNFGQMTVPLSVQLICNLRRVSPNLTRRHANSKIQALTLGLWDLSVLFNINLIPSTHVYMLDVGIETLEKHVCPLLSSGHMTQVTQAHNPCLQQKRTEGLKFSSTGAICGGNTLYPKLTGTNRNIWSGRLGRNIIQWRRRRRNTEYNHRGWTVSEKYSG